MLTPMSGGNMAGYLRQMVPHGRRCIFGVKDLYKVDSSGHTWVTSQKNGLAAELPADEVSLLCRGLLPAVMVQVGYLWNEMTVRMTASPRAIPWCWVYTQGRSVTLH